MQAPSHCVLLLATASLASSQTDWARFHEAPSRLVAAPGVGAEDDQERDFFWGDLNNDGWTDLVSVRKKPFMTKVGRRNVLFMNEGGVLVDRTSTLAASSDVPGDQGFLTPTNDRDVEFTDVDGDGWLDVVTAATISPGHPKHISHPRVYMNLGQDAGGNWLGLRHEDARIPDFGTFPNFCGLAAGDVTGDGFPDLYFAHYEQDAQVDLNDRLLVNDGTGHFVDESAARMTTPMLDSGFGTSAEVLDMNGDGHADVVKNTGVGQTSMNTPRADVTYNDPNNPGFFLIQQTAYNGNPYHMNVGDLNADGKPDVIISDDGDDRYLLNQGNDALGRVIWSPPYVYGGDDDGFASNALATDLDGDGWNEVLIVDMDPIFAGCGRRMSVYHNRGGVVGGFVSLEEQVDANWTGAAGWSAEDLRGTYDVAVFDLDLDGDDDVILGRCDGTFVWLNQRERTPIGQGYCSPAVVNSTGSPAAIVAYGSPVLIDGDLTLAAVDLPPGQFGYFLTSLTQGFVGQPGGSQGNLCLGGLIGRYAEAVANSGPLGEFELQLDLDAMPPNGQAVQAGETWSFQAWYRDMNPGATSNFTDGVALQFQ